jgi:hypothetical protein
MSNLSIFEYMFFQEELVFKVFTKGSQRMRKVEFILSPLGPLSRIYAGLLQPAAKKSSRD